MGTAELLEVTGINKLSNLSYSFLSIILYATSEHTIHSFQEEHKKHSVAKENDL